MEKQDIEELRGRVPCAAVLDRAGWAIDLKESTRRAAKYRRGDAIIIVIHDGKGWLDPLSDAKGDVYPLSAFLDDVGFARALEHVRSLAGFVPAEPALGAVIVPSRYGRDHSGVLSGDRGRGGLVASRVLPHPGDGLASSQSRSPVPTWSRA